MDVGKIAFPSKRDGYWVLLRRGPKRFQSIEKRQKVCLSTGIRVVDDPWALEAKDAVWQLDDDLHLRWEQMLSGDLVEGEQRYNRAFGASKRMRLPMLMPDDLSAMHLDDLMGRLSKLLAETGIDPGTANKRISEMAAMFSSLNKAYKLTDLKFREEKREREAFSIPFVQDVILALQPGDDVGPTFNAQLEGRGYWLHPCGGRLRPPP